MNFLHSAWTECPFKLVLVTLCLIDDAVHALKCPPIVISKIPPRGVECFPYCPAGSYCHNGYCQPCSACSDPYTLVEQGETEMFVIEECLEQGSCPKSCSSSPFLPKANGTLCDCLDVTPAPPTVPPTIVCKAGCKYGGCVNSGECNCDDGWSGALCDECKPDAECQHGRCNETDRCICNQDWDGINCDQDVSYCAMNQPCLNEGRCENDGIGGYTCTCSEEFTGAICENETSLHRCQRTCWINGTCLETESAGVYQCHCQGGYTGANCTQLISTSSGNHFYIALAAVVVLIAAVIFIIILWKKYMVRKQSEGIPGSSSNSGIPLITDPIVYHLEDKTVCLKIKQSWKPCFLRTCKCLMETALLISEDRTEVVVPNLREGFKYNFEIYKRPPPDVEGSDCSMAECEVSVEANALENGECNCAETIGNALDDVATKRALNKPLEVDRRLRERVAGFFEMTTDHRKCFTGDQTPTYPHIDVLQEVLGSYDVMDKKIGDLLSYLVEESSDKTEDFVEILTKFHPTCQSCARMWHQTHGGTAVFGHAVCNGVAIDV